MFVVFLSCCLGFCVVGCSCVQFVNVSRVIGWEGFLHQSCEARKIVCKTTSIVLSEVLTSTVIGCLMNMIVLVTVKTCFIGINYVTTMWTLLWGRMMPSKLKPCLLLLLQIWQLLYMSLSGPHTMSFPWKYRAISAGLEINGSHTSIAESDEDGNGEVCYHCIILACFISFPRSKHYT